MIESGKIAVMDSARGKFHIETHKIPAVEDGACLIQIELSGICATDVHHWEKSQKDPIVYGHEFCGRIVQLGNGRSKDYLGRELEVGDRIAVRPGMNCGTCYWCTTGNVPTNCENALSFGAYQEPWFTGGHAEYMYLPSSNEVVFKTECSAEAASLVEPLSCAVNEIMTAQQQIGDTVVVQGTGPLGLLTIACARFYGAGKIIAVGGPDYRLNIARELGADVTININDIKNPEERIKHVLDETISSRGADVVYECAGVPQAVSEGLEYLRHGGTYLEAGNCSDGGEILINPFRQICSKVIRIATTWGSGTEHFVRAMSMIESGRIPLEMLITHKVPFSRLDEAFECIATDYMLDGREAVKIALDPRM